MGQDKTFKVLTLEEHAKLYTTFKKYSQQDDIVRNAVTKVVLDEYGSKSIDVMSIGPGKGWLEDDLIKHPQLKIKSLLAIEPNPRYVEQLQVKSLTWNDTAVEIDWSLFDLDYSTEKRFDIILIIHTIFSITNPIETIIKAKTLLKRGGKILIFVQGGKGGLEIVSSIYKQLGRNVPSTTSYSWISDGFVADGLKSKNIQFRIEEFTNFHDVTEFIERKETPSCNDTISFFLQTKYENFDDEFKENVYNIVRQSVTLTEDKRYLFCHSNNFIIIE